MKYICMYVTMMQLCVCLAVIQASRCDMHSAKTQCMYVCLYGRVYIYICMAVSLYEQQQSRSKRDTLVQIQQLHTNYAKININLANFNSVAIQGSVRPLSFSLCDVIGAKRGCSRNAIVVAHRLRPLVKADLGNSLSYAWP